MTDLDAALDYLLGQSGLSMLALFWFVAIFEIPRYLFPFVLTALMPRRRQAVHSFEGRISVIVAGLNEAEAIDACIAALREQSRPPDEIVVVSDGSDDGMARKIGAMQRRGEIHAAHATELRSGKSAGANMAARLCTGDIIVNVDCDCSFDRHAIRNVVRPFIDPEVGAVSGAILTRNADRSVMAAFQAIEYMISISLGKQAQDRLDQVSCVSGAFGAFRREAFEAVGGHDAGGGEDLDLTLALRHKGWRIRFAGDAICYTDVPETRAALVRQRFRWERDAVHLRYRKHLHLMNPFSPTFRVSELAHELEFLFFNVIAAAALPFYVLWIFAIYGDFAVIVLIAAQLALLVLDAVVFALAALVTPRINGWGLLPFLPGYSAIYGPYLRLMRLAAYLQEWVFHASYWDSYVPDKVHKARG